MCSTLAPLSPPRLTASLWFRFSALGLLALLSIDSVPAFALEPAEVLLLVRGPDRDAKTLADHYRAVRGVPAENVFALQIHDRESVSRDDYERLIAEPLRRELARPHRASIRCLLVLRGLPLRISPSDLPPRPGESDDSLRKRRDATASALDSDLALLLSPPSTPEGWVGNPFLRRGAAPSAAPPPGSAPSSRPAHLTGPRRPLMVARIDGPTLEIAKGLIDGSRAAEEAGLDGLFCFDARYPRPAAGARLTSAYHVYDRRIYEAADLARARGLRIHLDERPELLDAAAHTCVGFYVGWYSLMSYRGPFDLVPGSLGYHVASGEAHSLRRGNGWVKGFLEDGISATLGPVTEPYLNSFPDPVAFLTLVLANDRTLAEIYWETIPHAAWRQILIGDPLYRPCVVQPAPVPPDPAVEAD